MNNDKVIGIKTAVCKKCGQIFIPAPMHVFKDGKHWYCKWSCYNHRHDDLTEKEEIANEGNEN